MNDTDDNSDIADKGDDDSSFAANSASSDQFNPDLKTCLQNLKFFDHPLDENETRHAYANVKKQDLDVDMFKMNLEFTAEFMQSW